MPTLEKLNIFKNELERINELVKNLEDELAK